MIEARGLTKTFGPVRAVDDVSFSVSPGMVTGFLGPNGAGKTTTLRMLLGLVRPTAGSITIDGAAYATLRHPLRQVGAALDGTGFHPSRTGRDHLRWIAAGAGLPLARCEQVLALTGLGDAARRRVAGYSMGMRQRLALAAAMLGDPGVLVLDEPANGLDPQGIAWLRGFLRTLAAEGRTVLVSSHVLSEVEQTVDTVVVLVGGRVVHTGDLQGLGGPQGVLVSSPDTAALLGALSAAGLAAAPDRRGEDPAVGAGTLLLVGGAGAEQVGAVAATAGVALSHLAPSTQRLEDAFLRLVADAEAGAAGRERTTTAQPTGTGG